MANISTYLKNKLLDKAVSGTDFTPATNLYIRLFTTVLTAAAVGTELANTGYAPKQVTNNLTNFPASSGGAKSNANQIDMDAATEDWDDVLAIGMFDASTGGNLYFYENLASPLTILNGQNVYFDAGDIDFSIT